MPFSRGSPSIKYPIRNLFNWVPEGGAGPGTLAYIKGTGTVHVRARIVYMFTDSYRSPQVLILKGENVVRVMSSIQRTCLEPTMYIQYGGQWWRTLCFLGPPLIPFTKIVCKLSTEKVFFLEMFKPFLASLLTSAVSTRLCQSSSSLICPYGN